MPGTNSPVVFHSPDQREVSPYLLQHWKQSVVELLVQAGSQHTTNDVNLACARFIGWCFTRPEVNTFLLGVHNVPEPPGGLAPDDQQARYAGLMAVLCGWDPQPVLVNVDSGEITCGQEVLWRPGAMTTNVDR